LRIDVNDERNLAKACLGLTPGAPRESLARIRIERERVPQRAICHNRLGLLEGALAEALERDPLQLAERLPVRLRHGQTAANVAPTFGPSTGSVNK
jgi:hypothetical protein